MNKLLQYMIGAGNVSDKILPQLAKAQKGFTSLPIMQNLTKYDNIPNPAAVRANAERLMQFKKAEANRLAAERQGTITQAAPKRSAASKAWAIATNPMTALSYKAKGLDIPENFERGSRNSLDMAVDMINPFGYANAAATIPGDIASGNIAGAGLKAATLLPFMSEFRGATKGIIPKINIQAFGPNNSNSGLLNYLKSNSIINPTGTVVDYTLGTYKGLRNQYNGLLSGKRRPYFEAFPATEAQKAKIMGMQDEAMNDALDFTKNYWYEKGSSDIRPVLENKMREILPDLKMASNQNNLERTINGVPNTLNPFTNTSDRLIPSTTWGKGREGLSQDVIDALREDRGLIGGLNIPDENLSLTLRNQGRYYKTPKEIANTVVHESGHTAQNFGVLGAMDEQGIRGMNKTWGEVTTKFDPEYNYFTSNPDTELGRRFKDALVEPYKTSNPFNSQTWRSSPNELHSELMAGKYNMYKQGLRQGMSAEEAMTRATNPLGRELNWLLENKNLNRHFKPSTPHEERLQLLKLLPAAAPVVAGAALSEQKYGGQPCYKCGGSVKKYDIGGYYDCPDQEKDPVTGKCSAEVARGKEAAAANKAASADMNAWAKQVAAMDKENARQNAAQIAGQLSFDYDWMQSPLDKADKKVAMAASKQFFQQNPNTFVPDDTSGYSPEQKYIIASKLKQRMSTPMGAKLAQQQYGVDPRYYDLQRIQSEMAPKMGGWNGMRNWLFNVYKQEGGQTVTNPFWEGNYDFKPINQGTVNTIKDEIAGYIQSPLYAKRQAMHPETYLGNNMGYYNDPKSYQESIASGKRTYRLVDLYDQPTQIKNIGKFKDYYDRKKGKTVLNSSNLETVVAHELGHSLFKKQDTAGISSDWENGQYWDNLATSDGKKTIATSLNREEVDKLKKFAYPIGNEDEHYDNRMWGDFANESYADLTAMRHLMYKNGLTKKFGDNINRTLYEKALKNKNIQNDPTFKRMQQKYSPGKIILLNNTIAQNENTQPTINMAKQGGPILDPRGQWAHPGKVTRIPSPNITMQGVSYPVLGIGSNGQQQMMQPGEDYNFDGASYVDEYPMMAKGGEMIRRADGSYSKRGLWDNIRANKGSGKKPTKQMLEQERKIKSKMQFGGLWDTDKVAYLDSTVNANKNLEFIQRAMQDNGMNIPTPKGVPGYKLGQTSSHLMTFDPKSARSYPEIVNMNGTLKYLTGDDAYNYAEDTGEYIQFPNAQQADYFSQNYKKSNYIKVGKQPLEKKHGIKVTYKK